MRASLAVPLLFFFCSFAAADSQDPNKAVRLALQAELEDFSVPGWEARPEPPEGSALKEYRQRLKTIAGRSDVFPRHRVGTIALVRKGEDTERLGVNIFRPAGSARGTLLFVHGYLSHSANFAYTFDYFTNRGWNVVTLDLPGHGLSTGKRADVDSFAEYGDAVQTWLNWVDHGSWTGPKVLLAHSLGAAASLEALRRPETPRPERIVFCAPLLRPDWYPALSVGQAGLGWAVKDLPTIFGWDDYLDGYAMPTHWFTALDEWLAKLKKQAPLDLPLTIYSGNRDTVVDEGWNRAEYRRLVPGARYVLLPGKDHLFISRKKDRKAFHEMLASDLGITPLPPQE